MNDTVQKIVEALFRDTVENEETRALKEEVTNNCQEHFADLIARGMGEDEAIGVIVESLNGMKEVLAEYPRKETPFMTVDDIRKQQGFVRAEPLAAQPEEKEEAGNRTFTGVDRIRTELRDLDLLVTVSEDSDVHLLTEEPDRVECEESGGCLMLRAGSRMPHAADAWKNEMKPEEMNLQGILQYVGRLVKNVAATFIDSGRAELQIPRGMIREMDLNTASGDIEYRAEMVSRLSLHSASGDIDIRPEGDVAAENLSAASASGDVTLQGSAMEAEISSISGDADVNGAFGVLKVKSTSGDAEFTGSVQQLSLHTVSGDVEAEVRNTDPREIEARSTSGDVTILLPENICSVHAETSSRSGFCRCTLDDAGSGAPTRIHAASVSGDVDIHT
jgi:hypothetical protein